MKDPERQHVGPRDFVPDRVVAYEDPSNLSRREFGEAHAEARVGRNALHPGDELPDHADSGSRVDGLQELGESDQVRVCRARPAERLELAPAGPFRLAQARRPGFDLGVVERALPVDVGQRLERQAVPLLLERHERGDRLLDDPPLWAIESLGEVIEFLRQICREVRGHDTGIHLFIHFNQED